MAPLEPHEIEELLSEPVDVEELYAEAIDAWEQGAGLSLVDRTLQFFTRLYLQDDILTKVDRASMMHGLEVRSPYLDVELVDLVRRIPATCKLRRGETKWLLKRALAPWLPRDVLQRPKKGFGVPVGRWFQQRRPPFDDAGGSSFQRRRLAEHRAERADHRLYLYGQWVLDRFLEGAESRA
jgi:asparagine synthase (glutamine-hydrolysing)